MNRLNLFNIFNLIETAIDEGINLKRLLLASGLSQGDFEQYHRDMLFGSDQSVAIEREIREWRRGG